MASKANQGSSRVDRHIAAADDSHPLAGGMPVPPGDIPQKGDGVDHLRKILFPLHAEIKGGMGPCGNEERPEALLSEFIHRGIPAQLCIESEFHSQLFDEGDFPVNDFPGKAESGNAHHHHSACIGKGFKDCDLISLESEIVGGGQPCRPCSDDAHLVAHVRLFGRVRVGPFRNGPFGGKAFQILNGDRAVDFSPDADKFARVGADQAAHPGKGIVLADQFHGLRIFPLADERHIAGHIDSRRAGHLTRSRGENIAVAAWGNCGYQCGWQRLLCATPGPFRRDERSLLENSSGSSMAMVATDLSMACRCCGPPAPVDTSLMSLRRSSALRRALGWVRRPESMNSESPMRV